MSALVDRIFSLRHRGEQIHDIANIVGLTPAQVVARLKDPSLADPASGVGLLAEAPGGGGGGGVSIPVPDLPVVLEYDPDTEALTTGSGGPDGEGSYLNDSTVDISLFTEVVPSFDLDAGVYAFECLGVYDQQADPVEFTTNGVSLAMELKLRSDDSRLGWAGNSDPFWGAFAVEVQSGTMTGLESLTPGAGGASGGGDPARGTFWIPEDVSVTMRAVNRGFYANDPYTGDPLAMDSVIVALGLELRRIG